MAKGIQVWRWRSSGHWLCRHRDGDKETATPFEFGGRQGQVENDWLIVDVGLGGQAPDRFAAFEGHSSPNPAFMGSPAVTPKRTWNNIVQIPAASVPAGGTVWYWSSSRSRWTPIYHRSGVAHHEVPETLAEIRGNEGEVVIDTGASAPPIAGVEYLDENRFTILRPGGIEEVLECEVVAVPDDDVEWTYNPLYQEDEPAEDLDPPSRIERQAESLFDSVDRFRANPTLMSEAEEVRKSPTPGAIKNFVKAFFTEATPSPTPGTTAILDFPILVNEFVAAAQRDASGSEGHEGQLPGFNFLPGEDETDTEFGAPKGDIAIMNLTSQALGALGAFVDYFDQLNKIAKAYENVHDDNDLKEADSVSGTAATTASADAVKAVSGLLSATSTLAGLVDEASSFASASSAVAQGVPFVGTAVSLFTIGRVARKTYRAGARRSKLKRMLKQGPKTKKMDGVLKFMLGKTLRKTRVGKATIGTAVVGGTAGTILGVTAIAGAANFWNPIGWVLLGTAAVGGTGVVGYKIYRRVRRKSRHSQRVKDQIPVNALAAADWLLEMARDEEHADCEMARGMLEIFGVSEDQIHSGSDETIRNKVDRHLRHV